MYAGIYYISYIHEHMYIQYMHEYVYIEYMNEYIYIHTYIHIHVYIYTYIYIYLCIGWAQWALVVPHGRGPNGPHWALLQNQGHIEYM